MPVRLRWRREQREGDDFNDFSMRNHPHLTPPPSKGEEFLE